MTEFGVIATWIVRKFPIAGLLPPDAESEARVTEIMEYVEGTVHGQGFGRIFNPTRFEPQDLLHGKAGPGRSSVEKQGREMVEVAVAILDRQLADKVYAAGSSLSIADAALLTSSGGRQRKTFPSLAT